MKKNNKGQILLLSFFFILWGVLLIYSLETGNYYKLNYAEDDIQRQIMREVCFIGELSNGSYIDSRFSLIEESVTEYCNDRGVFCNLTIIKSEIAPDNLSLLNYTHYEFNLSFHGRQRGFYGGFNC